MQRRVRQGGGIPARQGLESRRDEEGRVSFLIVEGGDGTGKTTLAEQIAEHYGAEYQHVGPPRTDMTVFAEHIGYAFVLTDEYGSVVFDRFHLGTFAYGPIFRPEDDIDGIG